jgi:hypothetical protein
VTTVTGVTTVTNVTAVASLTNQISIGSFNANDQVPALMNTAVRLNRQLITVS